MDAKEFSELTNMIIKEVSKVIVGFGFEVRVMFACLLAGGHVLVEGFPGLGKTGLVRAFSRTLGLSFSRIQFVPDLLPSDITGSLIFNPKVGDFEFRLGPIFSNIVLADEINRAPPKTQAALLEAMQEGQVTIAGKTFQLPSPFMVIATQNPIEMQGTYPLPEAQLDRFMVRIKVEYPTYQNEIEIAKNLELGNVNNVNTIVTKEALERMQKAVYEVYVDDSIIRYIVNIVRNTRELPEVRLGASPRATQMISRLVRAWAVINGRDYVIPDDVKVIVPYALNHRIITQGGVDPMVVIRKLLQQVPTPLMEKVLRK